MKESYLSRAFPWLFYSQKFTQHILNPSYVGTFAKDPAGGSLFRLCEGEEGDLAFGNWVKFYLLIDETDGVIADIRFQAFGDTSLIGAADTLCELVIRKNIHQASRVGADLIDLKLRDHPAGKAFPDSAFSYVNKVLFALEDALEKAADILIEDPYATSPVTGKTEAAATMYPGWDTLNYEEQLKVLEQVLEKEVQPYVALDAGGVQVKEFKAPFEVIIAYEGSCTSCHSSTGATLTAIQNILKERVHPSLIVTPDLSLLKF